MKNTVLQYVQKKGLRTSVGKATPTQGMKADLDVQITELLETRLSFHSLRQINHINYVVICPLPMLLSMLKEDQTVHGFLSPHSLSKTKTNTKLLGGEKVEARSTCYLMLP
jgi:hypothetical protein